MVRKRSRKYESDDNDSDSDIDFIIETREPAPKKYSLRERKGAPSLLPADFDYYGLDDEDGEGRRASSDDEDYELENGENGEASMKPYFEPEKSLEDADGLIDFEDIIRADIVEKKKIDYDNMIQKSEIRMPEEALPKRRGRPPRYSQAPPVEQEEDADDPPVEITSQPDHEIMGQGEPKKGPIVENGVAGNDSKAASPTLKVNGENPTIENKIEVENPKEEPIPEVEEDDDVIVLEEKHDIIVLDD